MLNVSGHRLGTAEIESALVLHPACVEAAVVGVPHDVKGQGVFAYVILAEGVEETADLIPSLKMSVTLTPTLTLTLTLTQTLTLTLTLTLTQTQTLTPTPTLTLNP